MTSDRECYVFVALPGRAEFVVAGRFRVSAAPDGATLGEFVYGRSYLERADAVELDPVELRLAPRVYTTGRMDGFFGAIRDAMPDYWGRLLLEKRRRRARLEEFDYLMEGSDDRAGALGFGATLDPPQPWLRFKGVPDLGKLQEAADAVLAGERAAPTMVTTRAHELLLPGTSMGGARPKIVVEDNRTLWLAKFGRREDRWNVPRVEQATIELGRACGLDVATSRVERVGDRDVLLVKRFDRQWQPNVGDRTDDERDTDPGGYVRSRMVSALTLLRATDTVSDRHRWSYLGLADEIRRASAHPRDDLRELFARMCFNAAVSNLDDHPRNHAMVAHGREWRLAPAYDLNPEPAVSIERRDLAMICGSQGRWANRANLLGSAGRFLLRSDEADAIFERVAGTIRSSWQATMRRCGVSAQDRDAMRPAILYDGLFLGA